MIRSLVAALLISCATVLAPQAYAEEPEIVDSVFFIRTVSCEEITTGTPEASGYAFVFLYGYAIGEAGLDAQSSLEIEETIEKARGVCEDNPQAVVLETFRQIIEQE